MNFNKVANTFFMTNLIIEPRRENPVVGVSDQVQHKSDCTSTEDDKKHGVAPLSE